MVTISSKLVAAGLAATLLAGCSTEGPAEDALAAAAEATASTTAASAMPSELAFDEEQAAVAAELMDTDEGRELVVKTMAEQLGLELSQAECFVENTPAEAMAGLADDEMTNDEISLFLGVLSTCEIDLGDLGIMGTPSTLGVDEATMDPSVEDDTESIPN